MSKRSVIEATGHYLPEKVLTNSDLEKMVETSDEWIMQRTGIRERRIAAESETTADMAIQAARKCLNNGGYSPDDIDGIIVATTTPDKTFPAVAVMVQQALGIPVCMAFDVQAVCTGFIYALSVANSFLLTGQNKRILVIGAEKMSSIVDWTDRGTCILFADGAGAVVLAADESGQGTIGDRGVHSTHLSAYGGLMDILYTDGGPSTTGSAGHIHMHGREVFKHAVNYLAEVGEEILKTNQIKAGDIDWIVPHQANLRIIESTAKKLGIDMNKVIVTLDVHGNTSAASIPLALDVAVQDGRIRRGDLLLLEALGGGLTWGGSLVRF